MRKVLELVSVRKKIDAIEQHLNTKSFASEITASNFQGEGQG